MNYVIINADAIQSRIDELRFDTEPDHIEYLKNLREKNILKAILLSSISLMPEIENAYDAGILHNELSLSFDYPKSRYMSHLKFKI